MSVAAITAVSVVEGFLLHRTLWNDVPFRTVLLGALGVNLGLKAIYLILVYPLLLSPLKHLPRAKGNTNHIKIMWDSPRGSMLLNWIKTIPNEGLIHFRDTFNRSYLLATSQQALLDILNTNTYDFQKPRRVRAVLARILGYGLILSEGAPHKKQRKALTPAFNIKNIRAMYSLMWQKTGELLDELEKEIKSHPMEGMNQESGVGKVEMGVWASRLTLDVIGPVAMGRDFRSLHNTENKIADSFVAILKPTRSRVAFLAISFVAPQWFAKSIFRGTDRMLEKETGFLRELCHDIVREKRAALAEAKASVEELEADILGTMMLGGDFSESELVDQMLTFLAAGHETTASAFTWTCYLLARHPEVQTRLRAEIRAKIPSGDSPITWSELESLPLLNGVWQEVLRLYPTVPATIREAVRDTVVASKHIPQGTRIILSPYATNRSPHFWGPNAEKFVPERWIDTDKNGNLIPNGHGGASTNFAQLTFLHGQRSCIGKDFARAELRCALAGLIGRFEIALQRPEQEIHVGGAVATRPVEGMHLKMRRVDEW